MTPGAEKEMRRRDERGSEHNTPSGRMWCEKMMEEKRTICNAGLLSLSKLSSVSAEDVPQQFKERKMADILALKVDILTSILQSAENYSLVGPSREA